MESLWIQLSLWEDVWLWDRGQWLALSSTYLVIVAAEMGDKSQLVCMTLAARHQHWPVFWGAVVAFACLNALAVLFGAAVAAWLPRWLAGMAVALMFAIFGVHALLHEEEGDEGTPQVQKGGHGIFFTTLALIFMAELGDKTQIAVAGLGTTLAPFPVWTGATLALVTTSALGIVAGRTVLQRIPIHLIHWISGVIFLGLAVLALAHSLPWLDIFTWMEDRLDQISASRSI